MGKYFPTNAENLQLILDDLPYGTVVLCAFVESYDELTRIRAEIILKQDYRNADVLRFIDALQARFEFTGTVWFTDGTWAECRDWYEGQRWWIHRECPPVPEICIPPINQIP